MKLTDSPAKKEELPVPPMSATPIVPEEGGFLEDLESAILWSMNNVATKQPLAYGRFATDTHAAEAAISSDELVRMHLAQAIPEWATGFYWTEA